LFSEERVAEPKFIGRLLSFIACVAIGAADGLWGSDGGSSAPTIAWLRGGSGKAATTTLVGILCDCSLTGPSSGKATTGPLVSARLCVPGETPVPHGMLPILMRHTSLGQVRGSAQLNLLHLPFRNGIPLRVSCFRGLLQDANKAAGSSQLTRVIAVEALGFIKPNVVPQVLRSLYTVLRKRRIRKHESAKHVIEEHGIAMLLAGLLTNTVNDDMISSQQLAKVR